MLDNHRRVRVRVRPRVRVRVRVRNILDNRRRFLGIAPLLYTCQGSGVDTTEPEL